jgi:hypothetical protein
MQEIYDLEVEGARGNYDERGFHEYVREITGVGRGLFKDVINCFYLS